MLITSILYIDEGGKPQHLQISQDVYDALCPLTDEHHAAAPDGICALFNPQVNYPDRTIAIGKGPHIGAVAEKWGSGWRDVLGQPATSRNVEGRHWIVLGKQTVRAFQNIDYAKKWEEEREKG